jgi:hypothetical protein
MDSPNISEFLRWSAGSPRGMKQGNKRLRFLKRFQNILEVVSSVIQNSLYTT